MILIYVLSKKNIFRAFQLCPLKDCRVIMLGQDPYPQKGVATGVLFGNSKETPEELLSPSLQIIKECAINYEIPHGPIEFDNTLETWAKQGILMINTALTCEVNAIGSHVARWYPFMSKLIRNISSYDNGLCFCVVWKSGRKCLGKIFLDIIKLLTRIIQPTMLGGTK